MLCTCCFAFDGSELRIDALVYDGSRRLSLVRWLGAGCRLYDGSEEAVACTMARRRLSLVRWLGGGLSIMTVV
jgi:hypothetical protein